MPRNRLLRKHAGQVRLEQWKAAVQASVIAELIAFVDGLADDAEAVANGCSLAWSNGMVEGFIFTSVPLTYSFTSQSFRALWSLGPVPFSQISASSRTHPLLPTHSWLVEALRWTCMSVLAPALVLLEALLARSHAGN